MLASVQRSRQLQHLSEELGAVWFEGLQEGWGGEKASEFSVSTLVAARFVETAVKARREGSDFFLSLFKGILGDEGGDSC